MQSNRRTAVVFHQLGHGGKAGDHIRYGKHLRLVEDNHAVRDVVELAGNVRTGWRRGDSKNCTAGCQDNWRIPVFRRQPAAVIFGSVFVRLIADVCVMRDNIFRAENLFEYPLRLLDNAGVGNNVNNAVHAVSQRMLKGEGHGTDGLPPAGRLR